MGYYELKFSSHDHSDTKQAQPWSCIGRYRGHGLKLPQPRFWPLCWSGWTKKPFFAVISLVRCLMGYYELKFSSHDHSDTNGWIRGAILTVDGIIFNCHDHEYGRYCGLESHKGAVFLVFLFSVSWLRFMVARSSPHAHANTKENLFTWAPAAASWPNHAKRPFWRFFHILTVFSVK